MRGKRVVSALLLALLVLPIAARADGVAIIKPRNLQSEAFVALHKEELTAWDSAYDDAFQKAEKRVFWRYPGSGQVMGAVKGYETEFVPSDGPCYVDGAGRLWVYLNIFMEYRQYWVCVSDPGNENLPADAGLIAAVDKEVSALLWRERVPVIVLVVGVAAVTGVLIYVFWYKRKK